MAQAEFEVPLEKVVQDALTDLAQHTMDTHSVQLQSAEIQWENHGLEHKTTVKFQWCNGEFIVISREFHTVHPMRR